MNLGAQLLQAGRPDTVHLAELVDAGERPAGLTPRDDGGRGHRADTGQRVELLFGRGVQVDRPAGRRLTCMRSGPPADTDGVGSVATELPMVVGSPAGAAMPTMICSPSVRRRAMFRPIRSAPSSAPPAALSASAMRAPDDKVTRPGLCTSPTTLTTTGPSGAGARGVGCAGETISTGGSLADATGGVLS